VFENSSKVVDIVTCF